MNWLSRMTDTITYATESSMAANGNITYGTLTTARARVYRRSKIIVDQVGKQRQISHQVATETNIPRGARVWLPGTDTGVVAQAHIVMGVDTADMLDDSYQFYILLLGK